VINFKIDAKIKETESVTKSGLLFFLLATKKATAHAVAFPFM
jgi:hypothetical protein